MNERTENLQRLTVWLLLAGVAFGAVYTVTRMYSAVFEMVSMSPDDALIAAFVVVGAVVIALLMPDSWISRIVFMALSISIFGGVAGAIAPRLGLLDTYPLFWRWVISFATSLPFAVVAALFWSLKVPMQPKVKAEDEGRRLPKVDRKSLPASQKQKRLSFRRSPKALPDSKGKGEDITAAEMSVLLETLTVYIDNNQNMAATARALGMTPPGVGDRFRRLYGVEPERMMRDAPDWVQRNIKD